MANKELYTVTKVYAAYPIERLIGTVVHPGIAIDVFGAESIHFVGHVDQLTGGTYSVRIQDSDTLDFTVPHEVDAEHTLGSPMLFTSAAPYAVEHMAYLGNRRYVRIVITATEVTEPSSIDIIAELGKKHHNPTEGSNLPTG